ncbi:hypothetical protein M8C21_002959, partial [Ambrosia artemisiifolia]
MPKEARNRWWPKFDEEEWNLEIRHPLSPTQNQSSSQVFVNRRRLISSPMASDNESLSKNLGIRIANSTQMSWLKELYGFSVPISLSGGGGSFDNTNGEGQTGLLTGGEGVSKIIRCFDVVLCK